MSALGPGSTLGPYEVVAKLGEGGMGEVYRASDGRLKRQVALKVLPPAVAGDVDRLARFQREAEVLASLSHPNIAVLYGLEESEGVKALVMELVEGPTLADRLVAGPIPIAEALAIAQQVANALAAAHDQGIIHRDLKPANIKVVGDGDVKVLDFGLAKAAESGSAASGSGSLSPTITSPAPFDYRSGRPEQGRGAQMTAAGMILGTAAYMSPEQAAGRPVDRRTDLWSFGVVLFEMLSGHRMFDGESVSHVMAAVLKDDPDWAALPPGTPAAIRKLLRRCLERDRRKRLADAGTAALECSEALAPPAEASVVEAVAPRRAVHPGWAAIAGIVGGALIAGAAAWVWRPVPPGTLPLASFAIDLPPNQTWTRAGRHVIALSPDASHLAYVANQQLYLRSFRELDAAVISGTVGSDPSEPTFSPDGQWIAFWSNGQLKKIPIAGGTAMVLADIGNPLGMSWIGDRIVAGQESPPAIVEVPANGGPARTLLALDEDKDEWVQSPQLLDEGRAVLFTLRTGRGDWNAAAIVVHDLSSGARATLVDGGTDGRVLADGYLVFSRDGTVLAAPFDERRRSVTGAAVPLQYRVMPSLGGFTGASQAAWSRNATLAYVMDLDAGAGRRLSWLTRSGALQDTGLPVRPVFFGRGVALSPDGQRVAVRIRGASTQSDIWIGEFGRTTFTRLTSTGQATDPVWTPDGARVCYENSDALLCQPFDGAAPAQTFFKQENLSTVGGVSPNGAEFLLILQNRRGGFEIWRAPTAPPHTATPLLDAGPDQDAPRLSPDGRWIAYESAESGTDEIYVRPYPSIEAARWQVSTTGGVEPRWSRDGRELYFLATQTAGANLVHTLTAVPILPGSAFATGPAVAIARVTYRDYDVAPDGRFLVTNDADDQSDGQTPRRRIVVVQNWPELLRARAP